LNKIIEDIAITGISCYPWEWLKELLAVKLSQVLDRYHNSAKNPPPNFATEKERVCNALRSFDEPPFTLQRMCELMLGTEGAVYKSLKSFMFALDKLISITTTQPTVGPEEYDHKIVQFSQRMKEVKNHQVNHTDNSLPEATITVGGRRKPAVTDLSDNSVMILSNEGQVQLPKKEEPDIISAPPAMDADLMDVDK